MTLNDPDVAAALDARYGRTRRARWTTRVWFVVIGAIIALAFAAWVLWAGPLAPSAPLDEQDVGYTSTDDGRGVSIRWQLTVDPGTRTRCALQAMDKDFSTVGWKIVDVPASEARTRRLEATVRTTQPAVSGLIYSCWLP